MMIPLILIYFSYLIKLMNTINNSEFKFSEQQLSLKKELLDIGFSEEYANISVKITDNQEDAINR